MGTRIVELTGEIFWAKVFEENRDLEGYMGAAEEFGGQLSIEQHLEEEEYEKLNKAKSMKYRPKEHLMEDGRYKVKFQRKWETDYPWQCGPIPVTKPDGSPWDFAEDGNIWNGSKGTVKLAVYDIPSRRTVGTRLEAVVVHEVAEREDSAA